MAAPILAKVALDVAVQTVQKKYPGGLPGFIATIVIAVLLFVLVVAGLVTSMMSVIIPRPSDMSDACQLFPDDQNVVSTNTGHPDGDASTSGGGDSTSNVKVDDYNGKIVMPLEAGKYTVTSNYGPRTSPTAGASSWHKGVDLGSPNGTPILVVADGVVTATAKTASGLGQSINVKHSINGQVWITRYGHTLNSTAFVKVGDKVTAGQVIAKVGSTGTSTGNHLHFEVWKNYVDYTSNHVNPQDWLKNNGAVTVAGNPAGGGGGFGDSNFGNAGINDPDYQFTQICEVAGSTSGGGSTTGTGAGPWGGHTNGKIPASALCKIPGYGNSPHMLRCDAAKAFGQMSSAYAEKFGSKISITDSYRTYESQVRLKQQKPFLAAKPGTSNHGWALATDLGGGIQSYSSPQYKWMLANAPKFGWDNPSWARQENQNKSGSKPEPWHFEYFGSTGTGGDASTGSGAKAIAKNMLGGYGWSADEMSCLDPMWTKESGWNYKAANPTSTARGIPQMMMSVHYGSGWRTSPEAQKYLNDPKVQITVGLEYVKGRYGSPCKAWAFWQKNHWY